MIINLFNYRTSCLEIAAVLIRWNANTGRATGTKEEFKKLNEFLDTIQTKVYEARRELIEKNQAVTAELLKKILLGDHETKCKGILPACIWQALLWMMIFLTATYLFVLGKQFIGNWTIIKEKQFEKTQYENAWNYLYQHETKQGKKKMEEVWQKSK